MKYPAFWLLIPFVASVVFGLLAPRLAVGMPPRAATFVLSVGSLVLSGGTAAAAGLVALVVVGETPIVAEHGHWSIRHLEASQPFGTTVAVFGVVVLVAQTVALLRSGTRHVLLLGRAWRASRRISTGLVVIDDPDPTAYAVPGWPGRIVASTGLLGGFDITERRVVLAHEQAHLDGHHDLHLTAAALASSINPFLARVPGALRLATERWADEAAAEAVGDRRTVAETIVRAATGAAPPARQMLTFGAAREHIVQRVTALVNPPAPRRPVLAVTLGLALGLAVAVTPIATAVAAHDTKHLFEAAELAVHASTGAH